MKKRTYKISEGYDKCRVFVLTDKCNKIKELSKKYLSGITKQTHYFRGTALMSYFAGIDVPNNRYVLHYDDDVLCYQKRRV